MDRKKRNERIVVLRTSGFTFVDIGKMVNLSTSHTRNLYYRMYWSMMRENLKLIKTWTKCAIWDQP
jgi:hypothetical protein